MGNVVDGGNEKKLAEDVPKHSQGRKKGEGV